MFDFWFFVNVVANVPLSYMKCWKYAELVHIINNNNNDINDQIIIKFK